MIYLFRMISDENQHFCRDVVIDESDTFLDLHQCIQDNLNYDPSQLASFFITNQKWEKQKEITLIDMTGESTLETVPMDQAVIGDYISEVAGRMIYVFDFFSERSLFIELIEKSDQKTDKKTPFVAQAKGDPPEQLAMDLLTDEEEPPAGPEEDEEDDQDNIWLDDLDPDSLDSDLPDDF
jgi:hypothetical protein